MSSAKTFREKAMTPYLDALRAALVAVGQSLSDFEAVYRDAIAEPGSQLRLTGRLSSYYTEGVAPPRRLDRELIAVLRALAAWHSLDAGRKKPMPGGGDPPDPVRVPSGRRGDEVQL